MDKTNDGINGRARAFHPRPLIEVDMKSILFFCLLFGILLFTPSHAQTACPPGMEAYGDGVCGYSRSEEPAQQALQQQAPPPQWATRWGAIATNSVKGTLGAVTGLSSKSTAQQAAMADCQAKGGSPCKLEIAYDNECATLAVGGKGYSINTGATADAANQLAMKTCSADGDAKCHVYYSACSLPVRIQ